MKKYFSLLALSSILLLPSCKKETKDITETNEAEEIFTSNFQNTSTLDEWNISGEGNVEVDNGVVSFSDLKSCLHFEVKELINIEKNESYKIKIRSKHKPTGIGDPLYCAGSFMLWIKQDGEELLLELINPFNDFQEQQFTFTTKTASPVALKILVGTVNGAWIDYIRMEKVE